MTWTLWKDVKYALAAIPTANQTDFPAPVWFDTDADIATELASGGGIKFTSPDGLTDLPFGLYADSNLAAGTVHGRVKLSPLTAANVGDVIARLYYSSTETTTEDKAGTVSNGYAAFKPMEEDPSGAAPQMFDWVTETNIGTSAGTMTSADEVAAQVGNGLDMDGTDDRITFSPPVTAMPLTLEAVFKTNDGSSNQCLLYLGDGAGAASWCSLILRSSGQLAAYYNSVGDENRFADGGAFATATWYHGAAVFTSTASRQGFLNGVPGTEETTASFGVTINAGAVGRLERSGPIFPFNGIIDEVRISSVARSADWIAYSYATDFNKATLWTLGAEQGGGGATHYTLEAESGTFALTGTAAALKHAKVIAAASGSFTVTGTAAALKADRVLVADTGTFTLTGTDAELIYSRGYILTADSGTFTLTGTAATLTAHRAIVAASGAFVLTGTDAELEYSGSAGLPTIVGRWANIARLSSGNRRATLTSGLRRHTLYA